MSGTLIYLITWAYKIVFRNWISSTLHRSTSRVGIAEIHQVHVNSKKSFHRLNALDGCFPHDCIMRWTYVNQSLSLSLWLLMSSNPHGLRFSIFLAHVQMWFFFPFTYLWIWMDDQSESEIHCKTCDRLSYDMIRTRICMDFFSAWLWWFWYDLVTKFIVFLTRIRIRKKYDEREKE